MEHLAGTMSQEAITEETTILEDITEVTRSIILGGMLPKGQLLAFSSAGQLSEEPQRGGPVTL